MLVVKMLSAKAAWLDAPLRWRDGRVAWGDASSATRPGPREIASAQRALNQIARYPVAASRALGDLPAFLARRRERLALAKLLGERAEPDLPALERLARRGDPEAIRRLARALVAEALSVDVLPVRPSAVLLACGAREELRAVVEDESLPEEPRALAALTLGALSRNGRGAAFASSRGLPAACRDAFAFGQRDGFPRDPSLAVRLLAAEDGAALARRCALALATESRFRLSPDAVRELLADGTSPSKVVALAEALADARPVGERILEYRSALPPVDGQECRLSAARHLAAEREEALRYIGAAIQDYAREDREPEVVRAAVVLVDRVLDLAPYGIVVLGRATADTLREGLALPPRLRLPFLRMLAERHAAIWDPESMPVGKDERTAAGRFRRWLEERHARVVRPARLLLERAGDADVVARAIDAGAHPTLKAFAWSEPDRYRLALEIIGFFENPSAYLTSRICAAIGAFPTAADARAAVSGVVRALATAPATARMSVLSTLFDDWRYDSLAHCCALLRRVEPYVPHLVRYITSVKDDYRIGYLVDAIVALGVAAPERAIQRFELVVGRVLAAEQEDPDGETDYLIIPATRLALLLAGDDDARFASVFRTLVRTAVERPHSWIEKGVSVLEARPAACEALAGIFLEQPRRAVALVERLGLASRLGPGALAPLDALDALDDAPATEAWDDGLALWPQLGADAAAYRRARRAAGEPDAIPPGVRRALALPAKLAAEARHVDAMREREPDRADLAARAASLRARLADDESLRQIAGEAAAERLARAVAEARMVALERAAVECFRARLASFVGTTPDGLAFGDDLLNAILMCSNLAVNSKLLLELLRAHVRGEANWREQLPANVAFLAALAERGVDPNVWTGAHVRVAPCPGVAGDRVRIAFESDPVLILQMGSYFDTCLSADGVNAFSAVTNACELNKRVLYATDANGRVVGRKLVALDERGALLGFHTYARSHEAAANAAVKQALRDHARAFASACGVALANDGTSPLLFAEEWYDDGAESWDEPETSVTDAPAAPSHSPTSRLTNSTQNVTFSL